MTPQERLYSAILQGSVSGVKTAIKAGADANRKMFYSSAIIDAANSSSPHVMAVLIKAGANVNARGFNGETPLYLAARSLLWSESLCAILLSAGARVNAKTKTNSTALHVASLLHKEETVKILLNFGAKVNEQDSEGRTPLHCALLASNSINYLATVGTIEELLKAGADIDIPDKDGLTPRSVVRTLDPEYVCTERIKEIFFDTSWKRESKRKQSGC